MTSRSPLLLGLIGDNISRSRSPLLHRLAGEQNGFAVRYDRLVPNDLSQSFEQVFATCAGAGYRGINVTYPYKERAAALVRIDDPLVRAIGAVNTVIFEADGPRGYNTDHSGFIAAYRAIRGSSTLGPVLVIGSGGVGKAVAFGLADLGVRELRLVDRDPAKAEALAASMQAVAPEVAVSIWSDPKGACAGAKGLINCTPVGMTGYAGTPLPREALKGTEWAFDAVYTPTDTQFLADAETEGLAIVSGWELFFHQGAHAWKLFSGTPPDEAALRYGLLAACDAA